MSRIRVLTALALLAGACSAQTVRPPAKAPAARPRTPAPSSQPRLSDAQLEAKIRAKLAKSKKISQDHFQVHVQGGVATIEGKTGVIQHKGSATRMAKTAGALAVNNRVEISDAARQKAAANLETGRRRAQIKRGDVRDSRSDAHQPR
jgi:hypothetical protein